ncbi:MAG TPA: hypothetical protein VGR81_03760 [Candidatus Acidoferrales bacterium]|nr:hypothetical protein [Candidatus Acidoferrales bacterium]
MQTFPMKNHNCGDAFRRFVRSLAFSLGIALMLCGGAVAQAQSQSQEQDQVQGQAPQVQLSSQKPSPQKSSQGRLLFGEGFIRGYTDFEIAPPHNEPDLGRCNQPQPTCSAFARYIMGGYLEIQPFARTPLRHAYLFIQPNFFFGDNIPQVNYTYSMAPLAVERTMGLAIDLPKHFELRITNHGVTSFSPFDKSLGVYDSGPNKEPLGIYNTVGVRWYFGGYTHSDASW